MLSCVRMERRSNDPQSNTDRTDFLRIQRELRKPRVIYLTGSCVLVLTVAVSWRAQAYTLPPAHFGGEVFVILRNYYLTKKRKAF